jgi:hypothetical protein
MSVAAHGIPRGERTGGRERTRYQEFLSVLIASSSLMAWLTTEEMVTSILELIDAGLDDSDSRKVEVYQKLVTAFSDRIDDDASMIHCDSEPIHAETVEFIDQVMRGGREAA